jgi:hypothetical protein
LDLSAQALAIIEAYCGQSFGLHQVNERIPLKNNVGRLTHDRVVKIDEVRVRCEHWRYANVFGATEWMSIAPNEVLINGNIIVVPGGVLDTHFDEAEVKYTIGYEEPPEPIQRARDLLIREIENGGARSAYSLSAIITPEIAELLAPFNRLRGGGA